MKYPQPNDRYDCSVLCSNFMEIERNFKLQSDEIDRVRKDSVHNKGAILNKAEGENISVNDSAEAIPFSLKLFGKARQQTTSGNQLLDADSMAAANGTVVKNITDNGRKIEVRGLKGHSSISISLNSFIDKLKGKTITLSCKSLVRSNNSIKQYSGLIISLSDGSRKYYSLSENILTRSAVIPDNVTSLQIDIKPVDQGADLTEVATLTVEEFMINVGETALPWEPYTGGQPSPSPEFPQEIEVSGESYNLLDNTATSQIIDGVTFTVNEDKSVTANGTPASTVALVFFNTLSKGTYIVSGCPKNGSTSTYSVQNKIGNTSGVLLGEDSGNGVTITLTEETVVCTYIRIASGYTANNLTFKPMIRKASVKNDRYMPYGVGSVEVKSTGGQLLNYKTCTNEGRSSAGVVSANNKRLLSDYINVSTKDYTIGYKEGLNFIGYALYDSSKKFIELVIFDDRSGRRTFTVEQDGFIRLAFLTYVSGNDITINELSDAMFNRGSTLLPYEPYKEPIFATIPVTDFAGIEVSSGGNNVDQNGQEWLSDMIVKYADGSGERVQDVKKIRLKSTDYWMSITSNNIQWFYTDKLANDFKALGKTNDAITTHGVCTHFGYKGTLNLAENNTISIWYGIGYKGYRVGLVSYGIESLDDLKAFLDENEVYLYYPLAEPIRTPLTAEEIAEIEKLSMFNPVTNISNDADVNMAVEYIADTNIYIDNLKAVHDADIRKLTAAIEALGGTVE